MAEPASAGGTEIPADIDIHTTAGKLADLERRVDEAVLRYPVQPRPEKPAIAPDGGAAKPSITETSTAPGAAALRELIKRLPAGENPRDPKSP